MDHPLYSESLRGAVDEVVILRSPGLLVRGPPSGRGRQGHLRPTTSSRPVTRPLLCLPPTYSDVSKKVVGPDVIRRRGITQRVTFDDSEVFGRTREE